MKYTANYHTHCEMCHHAKGTIEAYVKKAIEFNFKTIGISDHAPFDFLNDFSLRMSESELPSYLKQIDDSINKYHHKIKIYKGLEIEYFKNKDQVYEDHLDELDYLILGQHYLEKEDQLMSTYHCHSNDDFILYKETVIEAMSKGYFKILAHPDIFLYNHGELTKDEIGICKEIIEAAKKYNVLLEYNANGLRRKKHEVDGKLFYRYPRDDFWKLVSDANAPTIISADAHKPDQLKDDAIKLAIKKMNELSIVVEEELVFD